METKSKKMYKPKISILGKIVHLYHTVFKEKELRTIVKYLLKTILFSWKTLVAELGVFGLLFVIFLIVPIRTQPFSLPGSNGIILFSNITLLYGYYYIYVPAVLVLSYSISSFISDQKAISYLISRPVKRYELLLGLLIAGNLYLLFLGFVSLLFLNLYVSVLSIMVALTFFVNLAYSIAFLLVSLPYTILFSLFALFFGILWEDKLYTIIGNLILFDILSLVFLTLYVFTFNYNFIQYLVLNTFVNALQYTLFHVGRFPIVAFVVVPLFDFVFLYLLTLYFEEKDVL